MAHAWGIYAFRNLTSILFFNNGLPAYPPAAFIVSSKERRSIGFEFFLILIAHASILFTLGFHVSNLLLGYFLPIWIGHAGIMFYVYTNHMLSPMTPLNDPLVNSVSVRVPKIFDLLHLNFSYHTEHHIFPGMNSDYYPLVQQILLEQFPDRYQVLDIMTAWRLLVQTPRHYQDAHTLTDSSGEICIPCPLLREAISTSSIQPEASLPTDPTP
jgi:fatty acid desaturase